MKYFIKAHLNEFLIIIISFLMYFIGVLYSNDVGFYSREFMSSGSNDFDLFIAMTGSNIAGIIFGVLNFILNIVLLKNKNKIINVAFIVYLNIFIYQLFYLFLINLDTSLFFVFFTFDLFSIWFLIYFFGTLSIIASKIIIKKLILNYEIIKIKVLYKIIIVICSLIVFFVFQVL